MCGTHGCVKASTFCLRGKEERAKGVCVLDTVGAGVADRLVETEREGGGKQPSWAASLQSPGWRTPSTQQSQQMAAGQRPGREQGKGKIEIAEGIIVARRRCGEHAQQPRRGKGIVREGWSESLSRHKRAGPVARGPGQARRLILMGYRGV